jgi:hypothetical protein
MPHFSTAVKLAILAILIFANSVTVVGQTDSIYRLPAGSRIWLNLEVELNSRVAAANDTFVAFVSRPVVVREVIVIPVGTRLEGRILRSQRASAGRDGNFEVIFEKLAIGGETRMIEGAVVSNLKSHSSDPFKWLSIAGGAAAGAAIGAVSGSARNAAIGGLAGAGVGTGIVFARKGREMRVEKGQEIEIVLKKEVVLPVIDF